ncbi:MAG: hypothetical protein QNJ97_19930 [Myxococcota bacterium]|nr:hypothetical protein [Myxococcota bacterium]
MKNVKKYIKLNKSEFLYLAVEDVAPSVSQLITLRLKTKHSPEKMHTAFRHMFDLYPRLKCIVKPTLFSYRLEIIDNDLQLDMLFENSFKVQNNIRFDTEEFTGYRRDLLNESFTLQHSLPIKIRFLPEASVIFISIHHITCDGIGWLNLTASLLSYLNGKEPSPIPIDDPSMVPGVFKRPYITAPIQILGSYFLHRKDKKKTCRDKMINPSPKPVGFIGFTDMHQHYLKYNLSKLKPKAKELGCSLNTFFMTAITRALFEMHGEEDGDTVGIRLSYDLRPYFDKKPPLFGNYVISSILRAYRKNMDDPKLMVRNIQLQLKEAIDRLKKKKLTYPWFIDRVFALLGKKNYSRGIMMAKKNSLFRSTIHFSTGGSIDRLNDFGKKAQLLDAIATVPTFGLFMTMSNINGIFNINISYPTTEFAKDNIINLISAFENELGILLKIQV